MRPYQVRRQRPFGATAPEVWDWCISKGEEWAAELIVSRAHWIIRDVAGLRVRCTLSLLTPVDVIMFLRRANVEEARDESVLRVCFNHDWRNVGHGCHIRFVAGVFMLKALTRGGEHG